MSRDKNPQRENEMDSLRFKGFQAQFNYKLMYGNKISKTANTSTVYKVSYSKTKQYKTGIMKN